MSIHLAQTFARNAGELADNGDKLGAIAAMHSLLCCRDIPASYRRDAAEIMEMLLLDYFKGVKP